MRDSQKMKDKLELSLEGRHLVTLSLVGLCGLGGAFWLGIAVGKKLEREQAAAPQQPDLLAALDANAEAQKQGGAPAPLTFQDELTRKQPVLVVEKPVVKPVEKPAEKPVERPAEKPAEKSADLLEKALEKAAVQALAEPEVKEPTAPLPGEKYVEAIPERVVELEPSPKPEPKPELRPAPAPVQKPVPAETLATTRPEGDGGALKEALARASRPAQTAADGNWTLQLAAYQDRAEADRYLAGLRDRGYAPYIVEAQVPGKGLWFRVRMGRFASREAAAHYLADFQRETQIKAIVAPVK